MPRTRDTNAGPVAGFILVLAVVFAVAACGAVGAAGATPPAPASPSPVPTAPASEAPSVPASEAPATPAESPAGGGIDLDTADDHDVVVVVADPGGALAGAESGRAGDGMSVRWGDIRVENTDADTLRVTWVGLPVDAEIRLSVERTGDDVVLAFTQPAPPANSDAIGFDRVLLLDFASPVRGEDVTASFATAG